MSESPTTSRHLSSAHRVTRMITVSLRSCDPDFQRDATYEESSRAFECLARTPTSFFGITAHSSCPGQLTPGDSQKIEHAHRRTRSVLHHTLAELKSEGVTLAQAMIADSHGLDLLDQHQIVNVAAMTLQKSFGLCLFDEQGAGKTVTTIFAYDLLVQRRQVSRMLIVAPKSMVPEWGKDFAKFRPSLYTITSVSGSSRRKANRTAMSVRCIRYQLRIGRHDGIALSSTAPTFSAPDSSRRG